jgi:hypothetical protein
VTLASGAKQIFLMGWLWAIFGGFYLVAYVFWVPGLFNSLPLIIGLAAVTLIVGAFSLLEGFLKAVALQNGTKVGALPLGRLRHFVGGALLLGYLFVYLPPQGRIVPHWPLDLAITAVSGVLLIVYGILDL